MSSLHTLRRVGNVLPSVFIKVKWYTIEIVHGYYENFLMEPVCLSSSKQKSENA